MYDVDVLKDKDGNILMPATITDNVVNPTTQKTVTQELKTLTDQASGLTHKVLNNSDIYDGMKASNTLNANTIYYVLEDE